MKQSMAFSSSLDSDSNKMGLLGESQPGGSWDSLEAMEDRWTPKLKRV